MNNVSHLHVEIEEFLRDLVIKTKKLETVTENPNSWDTWYADRTEKLLQIIKATQGEDWRLHCEDGE